MKSETVFTFPGKSGDAIMQWPVAFQWHKDTGKKFSCWMDENTCKIVKPLFEAQPCVDSVELKPGIESWHCGGQPWHFGLDTKDFEGRTIYHLGMRSFPVRQITLQTLEDAKLPVEIDREALSNDPCFDVGPVEKKNRVVLHGQPVCPHNRQTPQFWKFLSTIYPWMLASFDEIVFVGSERDREIGVRTYPSASEYDDGGNALTLARLIAGSRLVIGTGSFVATIGGALKIPTIRVHDPIGNHPKVLWSNLGENQMNEGELELRKMWPDFRDKWLNKTVEVVGG